MREGSCYKHEKLEDFIFYGEINRARIYDKVIIIKIKGSNKSTKKNSGKFCKFILNINNEYIKYTDLNNKMF